MEDVLWAQGTPALCTILVESCGLLFHILLNLLSLIKKKSLRQQDCRTGKCSGVESHECLNWLKADVHSSQCAFAILKPPASLHTDIGGRNSCLYFAFKGCWDFRCKDSIYSLKILIFGNFM